MKGDLSRDTFDPEKGYGSVRLQQGRVVTDADWNEQADLTRRRIAVETEDVIGACGTPMHAAGFALTAGTFARSVFASGGNDRAWIVGEDGVVLRTTDGGATWTIGDSGTVSHLRAVRFVGDTGWAVGDRGTITKSTDAGAGWSLQSSGVTTALRGVAIQSASRAWAVGDGGVVLRTVDGGLTWLRAQSPAARLHAVHFVDPNVGVAVGNDGVVVRSTDGGATWTAVDSGTTVHLRALAFTSATVGRVAGDDGTILATSDAGATWTTQPTPAPGRLLAIAFRSASSGWAVGEGGLALETQDGGATWLARDLGTTATLRGASLPTAGPGWLVGDRSTAVRMDVGSPPTALVTLPAAGLSIEAGRCYVHGTLCELFARTPFHNQPDRGQPDRLAVGQHLLYLHTWQRHVSALEDPSIREVALGGPDTATRAKTLCQVKALALPVASPPGFTCASELAAWDALIAPPSARLRARAEPVPTGSNVCEIAAAAGYRRLENQLYRIEVQDGGLAPTFKWSRENGSVAFAIESIVPDVANDRTVVRLASRGKDDNLDLAAHDVVEIADDHAVLEQRNGLLFEYIADGDDRHEIVLRGIVPATVGRDPALHPVLRRWDHDLPPAPATALPLTEGDWIALEDGVEICFEPGGSYRAGDWWTIPARSALGDVEWPRDPDGDPAARAPFGIVDRYCRLAIVEVLPSGELVVRHDCRSLFPPLTEQPASLHYVSGDGQQGAPGQPLAHPLEARVENGLGPLALARVRFRVAEGGGALAGANPVVTGPDGLATIGWQLGANGAQRVVAELLDAAGTAVLHVGYNADFAATASGGGGCAVTIGEGGQVKQLTTAVLRELLERGRGHVCLCFLAGTHVVDDLRIEGTPTARVSIHGCGPSAVVRIRRPLAFQTFASVELAGLTVLADVDSGIAFDRCEFVRVRDLYAEARSAIEVPFLRFGTSRRIELVGSTIRTKMPGLAVVFEDATALVHVTGNDVDGVLSFHGIPALPTPPIDVRTLALRLRTATVRPDRGRLHLGDNTIRLLTLGRGMVDALQQLIGGNSQNLIGVFAAATLGGNSLLELQNLLVAHSMVVSATTFLARPQQDQPQATLIAVDAAVTGAVAAPDDQSMVDVATQRGFREAGNVALIRHFP